MTERILLDGIALPAGAHTIADDVVRDVVRRTGCSVKTACVMFCAVVLDWEVFSPAVVVAAGIDADETSNEVCRRLRSGVVAADAYRAAQVHQLGARVQKVEQTIRTLTECIAKLMDRVFDD